MDRYEMEVSGGCQCGAVRYHATEMMLSRQCPAEAGFASMQKPAARQQSGQPGQYGGQQYGGQQQEQPGAGQQQQQQQQQQQSDDEEPLVDQIAELKMIKSLQERVNKRTQRYAKLLADEADPVGQAEAPELAAAVRQLGDRQQEIFRITRDIVLGKNQ